ncbi:uncharacterized protein LOC114517231 [Dendronephthya gigantea]|uniref:uncharacterized protein LOC114517231 n=1 Tax=Dendronephthya gigantea TaxID=151771 RepID=UPI001069A6F0|nr:uncharacterized protein LOC114517231 [Dendronephthya gigantea]
MSLGKQQVFHLFIMLYYLQSSAQSSDTDDNFTKSTTMRRDMSGDTFIYARSVEMLNQKLTSVDPLSVWLVKDHYPTLAALQMDLEKMWPCIENLENPRFQLVLLKALRGESINVVVYGGSNCVQGMFPVIFQDWWNTVITPISGSSLNVKTIGIGGTGSGYYQYCHGVYLRQNETIDLVILETAVNDAVDTAFDSSNLNRNLPLEQLTRQFLNRPNHPAVFYVNLFLVSERGECLNLVDFGQRLISNTYGITTFNLRCLVCQLRDGKFYAYEKTRKVQHGWHSNLLGHAQIAFMIINTISQSIVKMTQNATEKGLSDLSLFNTVRPKISALPFPMYIRENSSITSPQCWSNLRYDYKNANTGNSLRLTLLKSIGFKYANTIRIGKISYSAKSVERTDSFGGFLGKKVNSELTVAFTFTPHRSEASVTTGSVGIASRYGNVGGVVEVWLDDGYNKRVRVRLRGYYAQTAVAMVDVGVQPGRHTLTMRIVKKGSCVLTAVFAWPSDWS